MFIFVLFVSGFIISNNVFAVTENTVDTIPVSPASIVITSPLNKTTEYTNSVNFRFTQENSDRCWYDLGGLKLEDGSIGDANDSDRQYPLPGCQGVVLVLPNGDYVLNLWSSNSGDIKYKGLDSSWFSVSAEPLRSCNVISDTTNIVEDGGYAVETYVHSSWISSLANLVAKWIWNKDKVSDPENDETKVFVKKFNVNGTVKSANIKLAADNGYKLEINGNSVRDELNTENHFSLLTEIDVASFLNEGENIIRFTVKNFAGDSNPENNPAGLLYDLKVEVYGTCGPILETPVCLGGYSFDIGSNSCVANVPPAIFICLNNIDDDSDGLVDINDPGCHTDGNVLNSHSYNPNLGSETNGDNVKQCSDGIDNDNDGLTDNYDLGCENDTDNNETNEPSRRSSGSRPTNFTPAVNDGRVLGATTSCGIYVDKYLRKGYNNDIESVKKVQRFLNENMKSGLKEDGQFGQGTENALKVFQTKQAEKVLAPWAITKPTGIFYLTTQTEVNNIMCPDLKLSIPSNLISFSSNSLAPTKK